MARIFISYRREDSDIWVSRLVDELHKHTPQRRPYPSKWSGTYF